MTLLHLLPEDATVTLEKAAKSLQMDPGDLLLLLWYGRFSIYIRLEGKSRRSFICACRKRDGWNEDYAWLNDCTVSDLASVGPINAYIEETWHEDEYFDGESCSVTLACLSVNAGDAVRAVLKPLAPTDQEQKDLSPTREKTLLKMIGALLAMRYTGPAYEKNRGAVNVNRMALSVQQDMAEASINDDGLKDKTLRNLIPLAMEAIKENMAPEKGGDG